MIRPEVIQVDKDKIQKEGDKSYIKKKEEKREKRVSKFLKKKKNFFNTIHKIKIKEGFISMHLLRSH